MTPLRQRMLDAMADPKRGWLSWQTPLANVLWGKRVGDSVELPRGIEVEIVAIDYPAT